MSQWIQDNMTLIIVVVVALVVVFILLRLFKNMSFYLSSKRYAKKAKKLRKRKYNGMLLIDKLEHRRKKRTNSFKKLKRKGKKLTKKYLEYKAEELPNIAKYADSKVLKTSRRQLLIVISEEGKTLKKYKIKKGYKIFTTIMDTYDCVDELIEFLHKLPDVLIHDEEIDVYVEEHGITIGYQLK